MPDPTKEVPGPCKKTTMTELLVEGFMLQTPYKDDSMLKSMAHILGLFLGPLLIILWPSGFRYLVIREFGPQCHDRYGLYALIP